MGNSKTKKAQPVIEILVAGEANSGKSTFFKQISLICFDDFSEEQKREVFGILCSNTLTGMHEVLRFQQKDVKKLKTSIEFILEQSPAHAFEGIDADTITHLKKVWASKYFQKMWCERDRIPIFTIHHLDYCMKHLTRINSDAEPTNEDILRARTRTTGAKETMIVYQKQTFKFVDVGGQKTERRRWTERVQEPRAVIFFVDITNWNVLTVRGLSRLDDSLSLWKEILYQEKFVKCCFILMMNKSDLLEEKIKRVDLTKTFTEYKDDPRNVKEVAQFLQLQYQACVPATANVQYHLTCALDTKQITKIFNSIQTSIIESLTFGAGLL